MEVLTLEESEAVLVFSATIAAFYRQKAAKSREINIFISSIIGMNASIAFKFAHPSFLTHGISANRNHHTTIAHYIILFCL